MWCGRCYYCLGGSFESVDDVANVKVKLHAPDDDTGVWS